MLLGLSLLCQSTAAFAAGPSELETVPAHAASSAVSGASNSPSPVVAGNSDSFPAQTDPYIGMTRRSERLKIESIDPTGWLARFGHVEATTPR